ncbi:MAG: efflux RND transporter periplasmic adaptor subunit [Aestuariibacter sp.]
MGTQLRFSPLVIAAIAIIAFVAYLYLPTAEQQGQRPNRETPVVVQTVTQQAFPIIVESLGTARANEAVVITAQETEKVGRVHFDDGDLVEKNQLLVSLNMREEKARVNELQINLAEARRQLRRITDLARENAASEQLLDERQAQVDALTAQLEVAEASVSDLEIRAPFSGVLGVREISEGALIRPGDTITTLDDLHIVKVDFSIAERHLPSLALGQQVDARSIAYPDQSFAGKITHVASRVDPITRAIQVRANIDNPELLIRPGMLMQITVQKRVLDTLVISENALVPIDDQQFVFVIDEQNIAHKTEVTIGERRPGLVQVISGISSGDRVVVEGTLRIGDGAQVKILGDNQ